MTYTQSSALEAAIAAQHEVDGKKVACKRAMRETKGAKEEPAGMYNVVKIFVAGALNTPLLEK